MVFRIGHTQLVCAIGHGLAVMAQAIAEQPNASVTETVSLSATRPCAVAVSWPLSGAGPHVYMHGPCPPLAIAQIQPMPLPQDR